MSKIKTREKSRDIKLLDKSAVAGQRMKDAFIRSKDRAADLTDSRQESPTEYAADRVQTGMDDLLHDAGNMGISTAKSAVRQGREAFKRQRARKAKEKAFEKAREPSAPQEPPRIGAPSVDGARVQDGSQPAPRRTAPTPGNGHGTESRVAGKENVVTERGRQLAKDQAVKRAETTRQMKNRPAPQERPAIKTRGHPSVMGQSSSASDNAGSMIKRPVRSVKQAERTAGRAVGRNARRTIKTAGRAEKARQGTKAAIKTAEQTSRTAIKTAEATAKTAQRTAQATAKAARAAVQTARAAAKAAATTAKAAAKAVAAAAKAIIAGTKALIAAIAAGGWVAVLVVVVICLIGLIVASCFGIFFSNEDSGTGLTMPAVVREINQEYQDRLDEIKTSTFYDVLEMAGSRAVWPEVLAIYAVKTTTDPENAQEVATMDDGKKELLKEIFWDMNEISHRTESVTETVTSESDDGNGNIVTTEETVTRTYLYITVSHKTAEEMADEYGFDADQREQLAELLAEENSSLWSSVLYGIGVGNGEIVTVALSQIGNIGGDPYWSWYGFTARVEWCACFVSWCADQCGYIEAGIIPKFALCDDGVNWFQERGLWQDNSYEPRAGDIIFFDWDSDEGGQDGSSDHVGIVDRVENGVVYTVEGNSGDSCRQNSYSIGYYEILGYGTPAY